MSYPFPSPSADITCTNGNDPWSCSCPTGSNVSLAWDPSVVTNTILLSYNTFPQMQVTLEENGITYGDFYGVGYPGCKYGVSSSNVFNWNGATGIGYVCNSEQSPPPWNVEQPPSPWNVVQCIASPIQALPPQISSMTCIDSNNPGTCTCSNGFIPNQFWNSSIISMNPNNYLWNSDGQMVVERGSNYAYYQGTTYVTYPGCQYGYNSAMALTDPSENLSHVEGYSCNPAPVSNPWNGLICASTALPVTTAPPVATGISTCQIPGYNTCGDPDGTSSCMLSSGYYSGVCQTNYCCA